MSVFGWGTTGLEVVNEFADRVQGKTIAVTGASEKGLGGETAIALAHGKPAQVLLLARSQKKVESVISTIKEISSETKVDFVPIELDDYDSVRSAAATINSLVDKLDILINNAGIMAVPYKKNKHGIESQFATNHLGHFLLTKLVFSKILAAGPGARIVNLTSLGHKIGPVRFDDYNFSDGKEYDPWSGYGQSKTANVLFSLALANKLKDKGITSYSVHPGGIMSTNLGTHIEDFVTELPVLESIALRNTSRPFPLKDDQFKSSDQGISTTLVTALDPRIESSSGKYFADCQPQKTYDYAESLDNAEKLWKLSEELVGEKFEL